MNDLLVSYGNTVDAISHMIAALSAARRIDGDSAALLTYRANLRAALETLHVPPEIIEAVEAEAGRILQERRKPIQLDLFGGGAS